jgi:hypothetical protein
VLNPDRIKPYLTHQDKYLRDAAVEYLQDSWSRDPDLIPMVLDACDRFGLAENRRGIDACERFLWSEAALERVLELLDRTEDEGLVHRLNQLLSHAPAGLLLVRWDAVVDHPAVDPETVTVLERRREFADWTGERLWEELQDFARRSSESRYTNGLDLRYAEDLVEALAGHGVPDDETVCRLLRELREEWGWLEIFLVDLAGARRIRQAIPDLIDKFHIDTDYLLERSKEALARIGDPEASRRLREIYPAAEEHFKNYTSNVFGSIKHDESESAILALLESETDPTFRTFLCMGLCALFSERGVPVVIQEIESGYDSFLTTLEDELLPVVEVLGIELPQAPQWKAERAERDREIARRIAEFDGWGRRSDEAQARGGAVAPIEPRPGPLAGSQLPEPYLPVTQPIRKTGQKVGRNDPCPCGSGKKYKKCCGRGA